MTRPPRCQGSRQLSRARTWGGQLVDIELANGWITRIRPSADGGRLPARPPTGGESLDLAGRLVLPGLWDHHVHVDQWAETTARVSLTGARTPDDVVASLAAALRARGGRSVLVGFGFHGVDWLHQVDAADLDRASDSVPLVAISGDWHSAWLNTPALQFVRSRMPLASSGAVREEEWFRLSELFTIKDPLALDRLVAKAMTTASRRGLVGLVDMERGSAWRSWQRRYLEGFRAMRVVASVWEDGLADAIEAGMRTGDSLVNGDCLGTMGPLKVIADGALGSRTAACRGPYPGGGRGWLLKTSAELATLLGRAQAAGIEAAVHAIGDRAVGEVLRAFSAAGARGSLEHAQLLASRDIRRLARQGLTASVQPQHLLDDRDSVDDLWHRFASRAFPFADLAAAGVPLAFGSDAPVAPLDPWHAISAATFRTDGEREPWHPEQAIPLADAIAASVPVRRAGISAAERLEPAVGDPADLIALDDDPRHCDAAGLRTIGVALTVVAGVTTHDGR